MTAPRLPYGLHDISADDYHADPCAVPSLSSTIARTLIAHSPLHAWTDHPRLNPDYASKERKTFDLGRAAHRAVLGKGGDYAAYPETLLASNGAASTAGAKAWAQAERDAGRTPLKAEEVAQVEAMADKARRSLAEMGLALDPARSELTVLAEVDGVACRAMIDNAPAGPVVLNGRKAFVLIDFKTCEDASPDAVVRAVENYGYDFQMAHYLACWKAATGEDRGFVFIFQEKDPPHEIGVVSLLAEPGHSGDWLEDADEKASVARLQWAECLATGIWPGYPRLILQIGARPFYRQKWQDTAARGIAAGRISHDVLARASNWQHPKGPL